MKQKCKIVILSFLWVQGKIRLQWKTRNWLSWNTIISGYSCFWTSFLLFMKWGLVKPTSKWELPPSRLIKTGGGSDSSKCDLVELPCGFQLAGCKKCSFQCRKKKNLWMSTEAIRWLAWETGGILGSNYWKKHHLLLSSPNKRFEQIIEMEAKFQVLPLKVSSQEKGDSVVPDQLKQAMRQ